ncbi:MAG: 16S rRNA (adenine(1518)-N(6)/adenine(1519)-N(6))-dimethyltransferase RsmA, partial [Smithellaceae bacterium]|nr:16S rRNA (adenine(1518)-N(6)/adenine(1519)-N(6))-dimethyltransferase RsmA [Smithellaceae bacterium]
MTTPKDILHRYNIRPNRKLSQCFLMDVGTIHKISKAGQILSGDVVVEIGAGIGVLTRELALAAKQVIAVEIDPFLVKILHDQFDECSNVEIFFSDILKFNFASISDLYKYKVKVIGNVPYNISSPVIFHLLDFRTNISGFTLMLQKEVVQRLVSVPNNKHYGVPSVLLQMYAKVERLFDVQAGSFFPVPKVESSIIQGVFREKPLVDLADETFFNRLVKASFAQRRKMLINNLKKAEFLESMSASDINSALHEASIDGKRRAENLTV